MGGRSHAAREKDKSKQSQGGGCQGDKERKGERMKGRILKRTNQRKSQTFQNKNYTNTRTAGVLVLF